MSKPNEQSQDPKGEQGEFFDRIRKEQESKNGPTKPVGKSLEERLHMPQRPKS